MESVTSLPTYFHLHLVSDSTGETLTTVARAATARYDDVEPIEHVHPLVRNERQLDKVIAAIYNAPGIVLFTLVDRTLSDRLTRACREHGLPCFDVLDPIVTVFQSYLNLPVNPKVGKQHALDADYFRRIDALNYTMMHDDGAMSEDIENADVVLLGVSRTSKTPTSIYLANRGIKVANIPVVPAVPLPSALFRATHPLIVGLVASPERIVHIRQNRILALNAHSDSTPYVDRRSVAEEVAFTRRTCADQGWPMIDVTRRSIEETAAAILAFLKERRAPVEESSGFDAQVPRSAGGEGRG
ncbi:pyruvate, water dikinase regulatory protein [Segnochrobactraceae bacterium EtOH-i3]